MYIFRRQKVAEYLVGLAATRAAARFIPSGGAGRGPGTCRMTHKSGYSTKRKFNVLGSGYFTKPKFNFLGYSTKRKFNFLGYFLASFWGTLVSL